MAGDSLVERLRNRINDAPMETEHLLDEAADRINALGAEVGRLQDDAARWRAFYGSERFYVMGAAGFDWKNATVKEPRDENNWLHFTLNIWDIHPAHGDEQDVHGRAMLLSYVEHLVARSALRNPNP